MTATTDAGPPTPARECRHDSTRRDGTLDTHCLLCGANGYWHQGHRHDDGHPSGKVLFSLSCPDSEPETDT